MTIQAPQTVKLVYRFAEGDASMADLLGGKEATFVKWPGWDFQSLRVSLFLPRSAVLTWPIFKTFRKVLKSRSERTSIV